MSWSGPVAAMLNDGRLHLQHGPIDLMIEAFADDPHETRLAYRQAIARFDGILDSLVAELPRLRKPIGESRPIFSGAVARRMAAAVWPYREVFITPMAAVAGAVADEVLSGMLAGRALARAYVNNGGDIALHLNPGEAFQVGIAQIEDAAIGAVAAIEATMRVRGIATSGWRGRSFSLGIADSVTVFAATSAQADAAATMIANAVNIDDAAIARARACELREDSDLGELLVTVDVAALAAEKVAAALGAGAAQACLFIGRGLAQAAVIRLQSQYRVVGDMRRKLPDEAVFSCAAEETPGHWATPGTEAGLR